MHSAALQLLRLALRNLVGYPLRSLLTTLGVMIGVGAVIAVIAIGTGAEQELLREIGRLGIRNIILNSVKPPEKRKDQETDSWTFDRYGLTFQDQTQIDETVPGLIETLPVHKRSQTVWNGSRRLPATVYAVRASHLPLFNLEPAYGRTLTELDDRSLARVCVVRSSLLKELGIFEDPVGYPLQIDETYFRIVGVLRDEEFLGYARKALDIDTKSTEIYVPYETVFRRFGTRTVISGQGSREATDVQLSQIVASVDDLDAVLVTARMLQRVLEKNHEDKDYELVVPLEVLAQRRKTQQVFKVFLIFIASTSLLVGGIGIANIMLASVTERTREIGVRRALGAKRRHIVAQFLTEATVISTFGGLIGVGAGFLGKWLMTTWTGWPAIVTPSSLVLALTISMGTGILFGLFPARRASLLDPIAALRHE